MANTAGTASKPKSSILQRLPRLKPSVWIILIFCIFLIAMVPMVMGYMDKSNKQKAIKLQISQLQSQADDLKAKTASRSTVAEQIGKLKAEAEAAKLVYKTVDANPEVSQVIMDLAWDNNITITSMSVSASTSKILSKDYPVLAYSLSLSGQVADFQNFLLEVGNKLPSSRYPSVTFTPAAVEGELDTASIGIQVFCNN